MAITKTQEAQKAFMGGVVAWAIQVAFIMAWMFFGGHHLP
jgi:hypothetical protein